MRRTHGRNFRGTFWIALTTTTKETMTQKMTKTDTVNQVTFLLCNWLAQERHCAVVHVFHFSWLFQRNGSGVKGKVCRRKDGEKLRTETRHFFFLFSNILVQIWLPISGLEFNYAKRRFRKICFILWNSESLYREDRHRRVSAEAIQWRHSCVSRSSNGGCVMWRCSNDVTVILRSGGGVASQSSSSSSHVKITQLLSKESSWRPHTPPASRWRRCFGEANNVAKRRYMVAAALFRYSVAAFSIIFLLPPKIR